MSVAWELSIVALWLLVLMLAFLVLGTLRRAGAVIESAEFVQESRTASLGVSPMTVIEPFEVYDREGVSLSSSQLLTAPSTILLFVQPGCAPCESLLSQLSSANSYIGNIPLLLLAPEASEAWVVGLPKDLELLFDKDSSATLAFSNRATPQAYAVGKDRFVLDRRLTTSLDDLRAMARQQLGEEVTA